jgi:ABC-type transport system involved in multi-copper enzyme maturation permease subunit
MTTTRLSGWDATIALAALSFRRALRGKSLWVVLVLALLPNIVTAFQVGNHVSLETTWDTLFTFTILVLSVAVPIQVASSLADEVDDKTSAYLWSRAIPRWSMVTGKLLGLVPLSTALVLLQVVIGWLIIGPGQIPGSDLGRVALATLAGAIGTAAMSAMFATLLPRFAVPLAMCWLLVLDSWIGALDMNLHVIATSFGARAIAGIGDHDPTVGVISLATIVAVSMTIAVRRIQRLE